MSSLSSNIETQPYRPEPALFRKITTYLRWIGAVLIVISACSFMVQGYHDYLPNYRYWSGIGITLLMFIAGLTSSRLVKENKGARIFFTLATAFLTVQITQVSAMLYAFIYGDHALQPELAWLQFRHVEPVLIAINVFVSAALWALVSYAGYSILARKHVKTLLIASFLGNLALMIPVRDSNIMAVIGLTLFVVFRHFEHAFMHDPRMQKIEGIAARALMALPLLVIVGRSMLHSTSDFFELTLSGLLAFTLIYEIKRYVSNNWLLFSLQTLGAYSLLQSWMKVIDLVNIQGDLALTVILPISVILFLLSTQINAYQKTYRTLSSCLVIYGSLLLLIDGGNYAPFTVIHVGIGYTVAGIYFQEKLPFFSGNIIVLAGLVNFIGVAVDFYTRVPWLSSIALGLVVILLASYIEKREKQFMGKSREYLDVIKSWG